MRPPQWVIEAWKQGKSPHGGTPEQFLLLTGVAALVVLVVFLVVKIRKKIQ